MYTGLILFLLIVFGIYVLFEIIAFLVTKPEREVLKRLAQKYPYRKMPDETRYYFNAFAFRNSKPIFNRVKDRGTASTGRPADADKGFTKRLSVGSYGLTIVPVFSKTFGKKFTVPWESITQIRYGTLDAVSKVISIAVYQPRITNIPKDSDLKYQISSTKFLGDIGRLVSSSLDDNPTIIRVDFDDMVLVLRISNNFLTKNKFSASTIKISSRTD